MTSEVISPQYSSSSRTSASFSNPTTGDEEDTETLRSRLLIAKQGVFSWRVLGGIFAALLVIGWVFIVVVLIQEEKWQLVLVAWLLLYAAAHFCYWYFKKHNLLPLSAQLCRRRRSVSTSVEALPKTLDDPPTYDEVLKSEHPPPAYWSIVIDSPKITNPKAAHKFSLFSIESIPNVFGRANQACSSSEANNKKDSQEPPSSARSAPSVNTSPRVSSNLPLSISESVSAGDIHQSRKRYIDAECPVFNRSQTPRQLSSRSNRSSLVRRDSIMINETINPLMLPIYDNLYGYPNSPAEVRTDREVDLARPSTSSHVNNNSSETENKEEVETKASSTV